MTRTAHTLFLLTVCARSPLAFADLPKAISVSPMAVAPGESTIVSVNGLNLTDATELWTDLPASINRIDASSEQTRTIQSAFSEGKTLPRGTIVREAEDFDRGQYRKSGSFILNGNFKPNHAEWDFEIDAAGRFILEFKFAAGASRPVKLFLNGRLLTQRAAAGTTGGFGESDSNWLAECVVALRQGRNTIRIELTGGTPHFDQLALVPTELPATRFSSVTPTDRIAPFEISVPQDSPVGIRGLRVATREGISNMLLFMVDDLPTVTEIRGQNSNGQSQLLEWPIAVEGYCDPGLADQYRFRAEAGQELSIEVVAARLGSRLDPVLRLQQADGTELAFIDDTAGLAGDCSLRYHFEETGEYVVAIEDALMSGTSAHRYRMRIGDFPLITTAIPAVAERGATTALTFAGHAVNGLARLPLTADGTRSFVSTTFPDGIGSGFTEVTLSDAPQTVLTAGTVTKVTLPCGVSGILKQQSERHACRLALNKGDRIRIRDASRSRGVPAVLAMWITDETGRQLAEVRRAGVSGQELIWTAPSNGQFELNLEDLTGRGGPEFGYHVEVSQAIPDFRLRVEQDSTILPQNGYSLLKVIADRKGYNGPIHLSVGGLGDDVRLRNNTIPEKAKETRLKVYLPETLQPGQTRPIEVVGTATIDDVVVRRKASTLPALRKSHPTTPFPPVRLDGLIAASVGPEIPDFFAMRVDDDTVLFPRFVGEVYFTVRVKDRTNGFKDPVNIRVEGLPDGFNASGGERPVSRSDNNEYRFQLRGPTALELGVRPLRIVAEASFKGQTKEVELADVPLKIIDPLLVAISTDGPITSGSRRKVTVRARRFVPRAGGDKKAIDVEFSTIPVGVSLPQRVTIAAGKDETTTEIAVNEDVDLTDLQPIAVTARTVVGGNSSVAVTSLPLSQSPSVK